MWTQLASIVMRSLIRAPIAEFGLEQDAAAEFDLVVASILKFFAEPVWTAMPRPGRM